MHPAREAAAGGGSRDAGAGGVGTSWPSELAAPAALVAGVDALPAKSRLFLLPPSLMLRVVGVCDAPRPAGCA